MTSIEARLAATHNRPAGFDYLRIALSISVLLWHTQIVCYGIESERAFWAGPFRPLGFAIVPAFFALSGFLVAGSLERNTLPAFLTLRVLRIVPALAVELVLSALLIGPLVTTVSLAEYFTDRKFWHYFGNLIGSVHYALPGVFGDLPAGGRVNLQLWTVPFEFECYVAIAAIALIGLYRRPMLLAAGLVALSIVVLTYQIATGDMLAPDVRPPGRMLVLCFLWGVVLYALRARIPVNAMLGSAAVVLAALLLDFPATCYLAPLPIAYLTVYLGLLNPRRIGLLRGADYSYGIYLYGFPVQQTVSYALPGLRIWWVNFVLALIVSSGFAFLSWHLVEEPVLARKKWVVGLVSARHERH